MTFPSHHSFINQPIIDHSLSSLSRIPSDPPKPIFVLWLNSKKLELLSEKEKGKRMNHYESYFERKLGAEYNVIILIHEEKSKVEVLNGNFPEVIDGKNLENIL